MEPPGDGNYWLAVRLSKRQLLVDIKVQLNYFGYKARPLFTERPQHLMGLYMGQGQ